MPTADEFRVELYQAIHAAFQEQGQYVDINAGELHRRLGAYRISKTQMAAIYFFTPVLSYIEPRRRLSQ